MNTSEWKLFAKELFVRFPGVLELINTKSPDPKATLEHWEKTLKDVSVAEAMRVLDDWRDGRRETPKAYERDQMATLIRSCVGFDRAKQRNHEQIIENRQAAADRKAIRLQLVGLGVDTAYGLCRRVISRFEAGELSDSEKINELKNIVSNIG